MAEMPESAAGSSRRNRRGSASGASNVTAVKGNVDRSEQGMLEEVVERQNMRAAYQQVKRNAGAPGIDGMSVEELGPYLREEWPRIKEALLDERYEPQPVKRVEIPKPGGGMRQLGIPTVVDRLIQQALHQVMSRVFEPGFSESSYGFRRGEPRRADGAGARKVKDKRVLRLVRRYLEAGVMDAGLVSPTTEGTPQGGPLSPSGTPCRGRGEFDGRRQRSVVSCACRARASARAPQRSSSRPCCCCPPWSARAWALPS